ncbi:zinc finger CCHC domain-containing protein 8 homolog [Daphnia pulicaria]|uniref:zinc finger CCHC domain-containing protein 8 homolog n=1 Tax=Daphnia pulicaria TaxID=35523 RepID=UPI001EEACFD5|nr:zinc finger CCHC domain-containing protein 8 homolog [Daphnia pulicaria]
MSTQKPNCEEKETQLFKVDDANDSEVFFVVDEVGSEHGSTVNEEDEPEVVFVEEKSCHIVTENTTPQSREKATATEKIIKEDGNDEPEIIFASESHVVSSSVSKPETAAATSDEPLSTEQDTPVSSGKPISENENGPEVIFIQDISGMFCLDTTPEVRTKKPLGPRFTREFSSTLKSGEDTMDSTGDSVKQDNRCFNCLGDHSLMNCPNPKNQKEISKNRSSFMQKQPARMNRYHIDKPSKFDHFTPGVISRELREALGLRSSEIPLHIYQMRILGYPPGWIEHIKEYSSGLEMIDAATSPSSTEGNQTVTYDYEKIIDYPGFNVPVDRRVRDDWRYLNFPPMQEHNSKEALIANLKMHSKTQKNSSEETNLDIVDMDTSIEDLEEKRQALLAELEDEDDDCVIEENFEGSETTNPTNTTTGIVTGDTLKESGSPNLTNEVQEMDIAAVTIPTSSISDLPLNIESPINNQDLSPKKSKLLAMGTPVSIRYSPYNILPSRDKFAQNGKLGTMGELELYENLPNSTGAFQKMRSLLQKAKQMFNRK